MEKNIVYCCDDNNFARKQLHFSIQTLRQHTTDPDLKIFVVAYCKDAVPNGCIWINAHRLDELLPNKPQGFVQSTMTFAKLFIPILDEFKTANKVLYLDNDIEIFSKNILRIFYENCENYDFLAIRESEKMCNSHARKWRYPFVKDIASIMPTHCKIRLDKKDYVNAGILLFNLANIRVSHADYIAEIGKMIQLQQKHPKVCCMQDEDIINMFFSINIISPKFAARQTIVAEQQTCYAVHYNQGKSQNDYPPGRTRKNFPQWLFMQDGFDHDLALRNSNDLCQDKADIVYVVGKADKCKDNYMLRASLRSIAKYGKNIGKVVVAGYPPDWLSDNVVKLYVEDQTIDGVTGKHWNILNCIKQAILQCNLTKPFLYSSDDHFYLKPIDFAKHPRYFLGWLMSENQMLKACPNKQYWGWYLTNITYTKKLLDDEKLPSRWAAVHADTWIYPQYLDDVLRIAYKHKDITPDIGFEPTCMFNAFFERDHTLAKYEKMEDRDRKVIKLNDFGQKLAKCTATFTMHENLDHNDKAADLLFQLYNTRCIYEK